MAIGPRGCAPNCHRSRPGAVQTHTTFENRDENTGAITSREWVGGHVFVTDPQYGYRPGRRARISQPAEWENWQAGRGRTPVYG
jgi:hypothetical protein